MKTVYSYLTCTLILGLNVYAQSAPNAISYSSGTENRSMTVVQTEFAPTHPDACSERKPAPAAEVPAPVAQIEADSDGDGVVDSKDKCPNTPKGYKVDPQGCPRSVTMHINFAFASNIISPSSDKDINTLTQFMQENPASKITIIGHTDNVGTDERNQPRSEARAKALAEKLIANGIDAGRIQTAGKGSKTPIASNATPQGRAENRRIEIVIR